MKLAVSETPEYMEKIYVNGTANIGKMHKQF